MKKLASLLTIALMLGACQSNNQNNAGTADEATATAADSQKTTLVAYFSASEAHITA